MNLPQYPRAAFRCHSLLHLAKTLPDPLFIHNVVIMDESNDDQPQTQPREDLGRHDRIDAIRTCFTDIFSLKAWRRLAWDTYEATLWLFRT